MKILAHIWLITQIIADLAIIFIAIRLWNRK